MKQASW